jgi:uncharacterized RDD family membrane protein YckC
MDTPITNQSNPYAPPRAAVQDVADPPTAFEHADRLQRFGASMIDGVLVVAVVLVPFALTGPMLSGSVRSNPGFLAGPAAIVSLIGLIAWSWITIVLVKRNGQSIAKWLLGIKVVRKDGSSASLGRIFWMRNVVNALPGLIPLVGTLYGLVDNMFIFSETQQCLHDRIADTIVVKL